MKLRLKGNSIRVRLDRRDIERLIDKGRVDDAVRFGPGLAFSYAVEAGRLRVGAQRLTTPSDASRSGSIPTMLTSGSQATAWASTTSSPSTEASSACFWRRTSPASTGHSGRRRTTPTLSPTRRPFASVAIGHTC